jgi:hypothetical protein
MLQRVHVGLFFGNAGETAGLLHELVEPARGDGAVVSRTE